MLACGDREPTAPSEHKPQPRLLVLNFAKLVLRVNDDVAPCVSVLKEGDCFRWLDDMALHVGVFRRPPIRPAASKP